MKWDFKDNLSIGNFNDYLDMNITKVQFINEEISKIELKFLTLREVLFQNCHFIDVTFDNAFLAKVKFQNCEFINTNILECNINSLTFTNCKLTNVSIFESSLNDTLVEEGIMQYSKITNTNLTGKLDGLVLRENIFLHNKFSNTEFYKCEFKEDNFIDTKFQNCDLRTSHFKDVSLNVDDLITSKISILNMIDIISSKGIYLED